MSCPLHSLSGIWGHCSRCPSADVPPRFFFHTTKSYLSILIPPPKLLSRFVPPFRIFTQVSFFLSLTTLQPPAFLLRRLCWKSSRHGFIASCLCWCQVSSLRPSWSVFLHLPPPRQSDTDKSRLLLAPQLPTCSTTLRGTGGSLSSQ